MLQLRRKYFGISLIVILGLFVIWAGYSYLTDGFMYQAFQGNTESIESTISGFGWAAFVIFVLLIIMECVFAPFPPLILYIAGGVLFGGFIGGTLALLGNFLGAGAAFLIARNYGRDWVEKKVPEKIREKMNGASKKYGHWAIFFLRLNPITSSDLFSYLAGLTKMKFNRFLIATTLGLIPTIYLQTYLGETIQSSPLLTNISIVGGSLYLIGFFILYFYLKKKK